LTDDEWTATGAELKQSADKLTGTMHETFVYDLSKADPKFDMNTEWKFFN